MAELFGERGGSAFSNFSGEWVADLNSFERDTDCGVWNCLKKGSSAMEATLPRCSRWLSPGCSIDCGVEAVREFRVRGVVLELELEGFGRSPRRAE